MTTRILLTGAASLLGADVLQELLRRADVTRVDLLLSADESTRRRDLQRLETYLGALPPRVAVVAGDLRLPRFGLSPAAWDDLAASFETGIHCAQRETRDQSLALARAAHVRPAETWIELLERAPESRLHCLSTAFVGGTRRGLFTEFDLDCGQEFHDAWERSLFEAETRLRESPVREQVTFHRPSHVLGRAATGAAFHLGGAYPLLATLAAAALLPGDARARLDLVPVDYVAAALVALACSGASGTFHLACGWETSLNVRQAADLAATARGRARGARLLPRGLAWPLHLAGAATRGGLASRSLAFETARALLHRGPVFDTYRADLALAPLGITRPQPASWLAVSVRQAETCRWEAPPVNGFETHVHVS